MTKLQGTLFDDLPAYLGRVSKHPAYRVWAGMMRRCTNSNDANFRNYGGRGITVDPVFRSSRAFIGWAIWNGWRPGLQLDREDNDGPYSPDNCRFVTRSVNRLNLRSTIRLADGRPAVPIARLYGISPDMLRERVKRLGWTPEQAAGIAPRPRLLVCVRLSDGRAAWPQAQRNGVSRAAFDNRLRRGWTPEQAAGIAPAPPRGRNARAVSPAVTETARSAPSRGVMPGQGEPAENVGASGEGMAHGSAVG